MRCCSSATGFETAAAALAATLERVPIVHLHGGEQTLGAFDDALRHAITKLSHLHLVSQRGARPARDRDGRGPGHASTSSARRAWTPRPATTCRTATTSRRDLGLALVAAGRHRDRPPDDPRRGSGGCRARRRRGDGRASRPRTSSRSRTPTPARTRSADRRSTAAARSPGRIAVDALGERRYWGLLRIADAMLGNSSSALDRGSGRRTCPPSTSAIARPARRAVPTSSHAPADPQRSPTRCASARSRRPRAGLAAARPDASAMVGPARASRISSPHGDHRDRRASRPITVPGVTATPLVVLGGGEHAAWSSTRPLARDRWVVQGYAARRARNPAATRPSTHGSATTRPSRRAGRRPRPG